jgi:hypothetical protein
LGVALASLTRPDTQSSQAAFPQQGAQKAGLGFLICRLLAVSCLHTGVILNAAVGSFKDKGSDEHSLLRQVLDTFQKGTTVVGDAFFESIWGQNKIIKTPIVINPKTILGGLLICVGLSTPVL